MKRSHTVRAIAGSALVSVLLASLSSCASAESDGDGLQRGVESPEPIGVSVEALTATDPLSKAVTDTCTTSSVRALSLQLVAEIECLRPNTLTKIDKVPNTTLGPAVLPYLQSVVVPSLAAVAKTRSKALLINSALRTLPQQYLLYRWYLTGRCNISLAATPGKSNHESALAVDVDDSVGWRSAFSANKFRWLGSSDPVHYDYTGGGVNIRGLSVQAFQRLWNRNNPKDLIAEDGQYGPTTEAKLASSPVGGFALGAKCDAQTGDAGPDAHADAGEGGVVPDADLPPDENPPEPDAPEPTPDAPPPDNGCSCHVMSPSDSSSLPSGVCAALVFAAVLVGRRRR